MKTYVRRQNRFKRGRQTRLKKRGWYFNAGANLPFLGKTTVSLGKRSIINTVRRGLEDPLHKLWSGQGIAPPQQNLLHNTLYTLNLLGNIPQGDTSQSRSADNIHVDALKIRLLFSTETTTNKQIPKEYRVMIVKHDTEGQAASDAFGSTLGATDLFQGNNVVVYEQINPKNCTVIYEKRCKLKPSISATNDMCEISDIIRLNTTFTYKTNSNYGKMHNYYLVVCGYEPDAAAAATVGRVTFFGDLIFKDSK